MIEAALVKGRPVPLWAHEEPPIYQGDDFFLTAFFDLSTCRYYSEGTPGHIPWTSIIQYADWAGLYPEVCAGFVRIIRAMDAVFLKWHAKKQKELVDREKRKTKI